MARMPAIFNFSGPYGVGKDTLLNSLLQRHADVVHRVSTITTRPSSPDADPSYRTVTPEEFARTTATDRWIVTTQLGGDVRYGTSLDEIDTQIGLGKVCVHSIFAGHQGTGRLREVYGRRLFSVGVLAAHGGRAEQLEVLRDRLVARGRDTAETVEQRLRYQLEPIDYVLANPSVSTPDGPLPVFDHIVVNDRLDDSVDAVQALWRQYFERPADESVRSRIH